MKIQYVPPSELVTRPWAAGKTTELFIFPPDASYEARDFECRVSSATMESDSEFSNFTGFQRILLLLSGGGVRLRINEVEQVLDKKLEPLLFEGAATTEAELLSGPVVDFNLIARPGSLARITKIALTKEPVEVELPRLRLNTISLPTMQRFDLLYSHQVDFRVTVQDRPFDVEKGGVFSLQRKHGGELNVTPRLESTGEAGVVLLVSLLVAPPNAGDGFCG